jgi:hypothetical protein
MCRTESTDRRLVFEVDETDQGKKERAYDRTLIVRMSLDRVKRNEDEVGV